MTVNDLFTLLNQYPGTAEVEVMAFDWYPKVPLQIAQVVDANNAQTPTTPLLVIFGGPQSFNSYDASGYKFPVPRPASS
jgi:hypothetical protein